MEYTMKIKKNHSPIFIKPKFIDGIDVKNIHCYTYEEMLQAEEKNHNSEIQFAIFNYLVKNYWKEKYFLKEAKKEYYNQRKTYDFGIKQKYQEYLKEDSSVKYSAVKKSIILDIAKNIAFKKAELWLEKAFFQNDKNALLTVAKRELRKVDENKNKNATYAISLLERALEKNSTEAAEILIPIYLKGLYGISKNAKRANDLIKKFSTKEYKFYLSEKKDFCSIKKIDNVIINNNALCKEMVTLYDEMALLKNQLDSMIKSGKSYYKGYKIFGEITFEIETPIVTKAGTEFDTVECDWNLVFEDKKPIPNKIDALDLWKNHNKGQLQYPQEFICKATYDFIYPQKKESSKYSQNYIPYEIFKNASPENFFHSISVVITKNHLPYEKINDYEEEKFSWKTGHYRRNLFWFEKKKILKIARKLLDIETEIHCIGKKIQTDFQDLSKTKLPFVKDLKLWKNVNYKFCHPFGIITKADARKSYLVNNMLTVSEENYSKNWLEFFWEKPYSDYHLTYLNHSLWDHCNLNTKDILKMNTKNFCSCFELR